jgi:hypothetical protein
MPSIKKTSRREHSEREIATILVLHAKGYSAREIGDEINIPKLIINKIIQRAINSLNRWYLLGHTELGACLTHAWRLRPYQREIGI